MSKDAVQPVSTVELFTDGSCCHGNPGPGGWAFILRHSNRKVERVVSGGLGYTSNERMEMIAVINGLRSLKRSCRVTLFTDSQSVVAGITQRAAMWKQFGWRKTQNGKKYVPNADLWMLLAKQCSRHTVDARWVKGHAGHLENERCDKLARQEARKAIEHLETSAEKTGAGIDPLLADWVSAEMLSADSLPKPAAKRGTLAPGKKPSVKSMLQRPSDGKISESEGLSVGTALFPRSDGTLPVAPAVKVDGPIVDLFTDGACVDNPGPGGWAFILRHRTTRNEKAVSGGMAGTTNNRMELTAAIEGLKALRRPCQVNLFTDSQYVAKGISEWSGKWKKFGWRKTPNAKVNVLNADLWETLDKLRHRMRS